MCMTSIYGESRLIFTDPTRPGMIDPDNVMLYGVPHLALDYGSATSFFAIGLRYIVGLRPGIITPTTPILDRAAIWGDEPFLNEWESGLNAGYTLYYPTYPGKPNVISPSWVLLYDSRDALSLIMAAPEKFEVGNVETVRDWDLIRLGVDKDDDHPKTHQWSKIIAEMRAD